MSESFRERKPNDVRTVRAQEGIFDELRKLRILKEYELGVVVTPADYDSGQCHGLKAGRLLRIGEGEFAQQGDVLWEDGTGLIGE